MEIMDLPFHPMLVHFPIALFITACGLQILGLTIKKDSLTQTAFIVYIVATLMTPIAVVTGWLEANEHHLHHRVLDLHRFFAFMTMGGSLISIPILFVIRKKIRSQFDVVFLLIFLFIVILIALTAYNGGRLVFDYGVGMKE